MMSPSSKASGADAIRKNELACSEGKKRRKRSPIEHSISHTNFEFNTHTQYLSIQDQLVKQLEYVHRVVTSSMLVK